MNDVSHFPPPPDFASLSPAQLTGAYLAWRRGYRTTVKRAAAVSKASGGIRVDGNRLAYASILFTRICVTAKSLETLLPDCRPREHWDFGAVASIARNLSEAYLWFFWLCEDDILEEVRQGRFILLYCFDNGSRARLFNEGQPPANAEVVADLERQFDANPYLRTFSEKQRRDALRGHKTPFVQDDVIERIGLDRDLFRMHYRFYSQYTHTGPVAYFRMLEHDRGTGVETDHEKRYMTLAIMFACGILARATEGHMSLFPDATRGL